MKNETFRIFGQVIDQKTKLGIHDLKVEAWDKDLIFDDLVGSTITTNNGKFIIVFDNTYFSELFVDRKPDLFFKVFFKDTLIKDTRNSVLWNQKAGDLLIKIDVDLPNIIIKQNANVVVFDLKNNPLPNAKVNLITADGSGKSVELKYDKNLGKYIVPDIEFGKYILAVQVDGMESDQREVIMGPNGLNEVFFVGKQGMSFYFRGNVKVPYEPQNNKIAVSLKGKHAEEFEKQLLDIVRRENLPLELDVIGEIVKKSNLRVLKMPDGTSEEMKSKIMGVLAKQSLVNYVGPLLHQDNKSISILTNELILRTKPSVSQEELEKILQSVKLTIVRKISYAANTYIIKSDGPANLKLLDTQKGLMKNNIIDYIEPNLVSNPMVNYTPNDYLFANQPHHAIINTEGAWDVTMGSNNIIIAVVDAGGDYDHPDFTNPASLGWNKIHARFDFTGMDTDPIGDSHGSKSCGIATANADNNEGIAGVAPGCKLMPIKWSSGSLSNWADLYMWVAGFNPGSSTPGFPAQISPGADVISNSIGRRDLPMSTIMKDTFDYITNHGRGGKGCVVVFAAGNDNSDLATIDFSQWAAYDRTIAVASSAISPPDAAERKVSTSNYGDEIDVCAPGGGPSGGAEARTLSASNVGAGDTAGSASATSLDYDDFGQTSCACPQVAGVAALMLSINPDLDWSEVKQIIRDTAVTIDAANTNPIGQWSGGFSKWYGYGRINAQLAVQEAHDRIHVHPDFERIPERVNWLVEGFIWDKRTWVMYLIVNYLSMAQRKFTEVQPDKQFYIEVSKIVQNYMQEGTEPPQEIASAIYNIADDITSGADVIIKTGDYIALQSFIRK